MICVAIVLGTFGFLAMRHARRCPGSHGGWHGGGWHGWHRHHHRRRHQRWMLHHLLARIDASPAQERAILTELDKLEDRLHAARRGLGGMRADLGAALRGPALDDAALGAALGTLDATTGELRAALIDALRGIHAVLDDRQRADLADLLAGDRGGWWRGGPYR